MVCGTACCGYGGESVCYLWDRIVCVWVSDIVLCVEKFGVGFCEWVCAVCGTFCFRYERVSVCCV